MHKEHKNILYELKNYQGNGTAHTSSDSYILSGHPYFDISVPLRRHIVKTWLKTQPSISFEEFIGVVNSLYHGTSHEEKTMASYLLGYHSKYRARIKPTTLHQWLNELVGWAEIDSLCQNVFTAEEMLNNWEAWQKLIRQLSTSKNINKRRAALVFLTGPTYQSDDRRLHQLAFEVIDVLMNEKEIIITKAISWLLRSMSVQKSTDVKNYLDRNKETLPAVAIRETWRKISTGKK